MPLLHPVAEVVTNSSVVSWAKFIIVRASRSGTQASTAQRGYIPAGSQEGLQHTAHVTAGSNDAWVRSYGNTIASDRGIYVNHHFEQSSFEMVNGQAAR
jgi:hypothetical protein